MSVSRETNPPEGMREIFGTGIDLVTRYAQILSTTGVTRGVIGPREVPRIWERHLVNCGVVASRLPEHARVADVGTGGGLPGLVWAIMRADTQVVLVDPLLRRTAFLEEVIQELNISNATVVRARAEEVTDIFDVVTARAVARLDKLAKWTMPLVRQGGILLALKGQDAAVELDESRAVLNRLGASSMQVTCYETTDIPTRVVEVHK